MKRILTIAFLSVALMAIVDGVISPGYFPKAAAKVVLFLAFPIFAGSAGNNLKSVLKPGDRKELIQSLLLGAAVYGIIIGAYFVLSPFLDLVKIKDMLHTRLGVNRDNFILVALYISVFNSLLEEFFFRGYIFLGLLGKTSRIKAHGISAGIFAVYHVAILKGWFSPLIFAVSMLGLFTGGILFNLLNERNKNIISSWLVHMGANLAINTVGLLMFGIL